MDESRGGQHTERGASGEDAISPLASAADEPRLLHPQGVEVCLLPAEGVFIPSPNGLFYAESVTVRRGERVLDIGTGSGVLAIMAAKLGARVEATDTDPRAIAAARRNAAVSGVAIRLHEGALFAGAEGAFDVILANLPNEIVAPAYLARLSPEDARVFAGGERGNRVILELIAEAGRHMHPASRLYLPVHTLTDYHGTLRAALGGYEARLLGIAPLPVKPFVVEYLDYYRELHEAGVIHIFRERGVWHSWAYVYELRLAPLAGGGSSGTR